MNGQPRPSSRCWAPTRRGCVCRSRAGAAAGSTRRACSRVATARGALPGSAATIRARARAVVTGSDSSVASAGTCRVQGRLHASRRHDQDGRVDALGDPDQQLVGDRAAIRRLADDVHGEDVASGGADGRGQLAEPARSVLQLHVNAPQRHDATSSGTAPSSPSGVTNSLTQHDAHVCEACGDSRLRQSAGPAGERDLGRGVPHRLLHDERAVPRVEPADLVGRRRAPPARRGSCRPAGSGSAGRSRRPARARARSRRRRRSAATTPGRRRAGPSGDPPNSARSNARSCSISSA